MNHMTQETERRVETTDKVKPKPSFSFGDLGLGAGNLNQDLQFIRDLNGKNPRVLPEAFGSLTLTQNGQPLEAGLRNQAGAPELHQRPHDSTRVAGREFTITRDAGGRPVEFTDKGGRWRAKGDGQTFVNVQDQDQPRYRRGVPSIDAAGNFKFKDTDFGVTHTRMKDGRGRQEIESAGGTRYAIETNRDGRPTRLEDERGAWTSSDGVNWKNEKGEVRAGRPSISKEGEYRFSSPENPQSVASKELQAARELQKQINEKHGVTVSPPGTHTSYGPTDQPSLRELTVLERTLSRSPNGSLAGLKIDFLGAGKGDKGGFGSYDANRFQLFQNSRVTPEGWMGLEGTALHELVHHEQMKMGSEFWTGKNPPPEVAEMRRAYGWEYDQKYGNVMLDRFGGRWSPQEDKNHPEHGPQTKWVWVGQGEPPDGQHTRSPKEMAAIAKVPMISRYNDYPYESHAEAVALLRQNPARLAALSPSAYEATRNWDQMQLDRHYGKGTHMRSHDGLIVPNTDENQRQRRQMEEKARHEHLTGHGNGQLFSEEERSARPCCTAHRRK
jgi:hypothetical protein